MELALRAGVLAFLLLFLILSYTGVISDQCLFRGVGSIAHIGYFSSMISET